MHTLYLNSIKSLFGLITAFAGLFLRLFTDQALFAPIFIATFFFPPPDPGGNILCMAGPAAIPPSHLPGLLVHSDMHYEDAEL